MARVCMIGLGYIGLPTAALLANRGHDVLGVDVNEDVVKCVNSGKIHIVEPELEELVSSAVKKKTLRAATVISPADIFIIAVPTPFKMDLKAKKQPDLSYVMSAVEMIAPSLVKGNLLIIESTSPVGTTEEVASKLGLLRPDLNLPSREDGNSDISIAYCPERVLPGKIIRELTQNDRIIGGISIDCSKIAFNFYKSFVEGECFLTNAATAEMVKLTENASRDVQIAFANEVSMICDDHNISSWDVIKFANKHPRVNILEPGPGVGGHCIAVDPWFIVSSSPQNSKLIRVAREVNDQKPIWVFNKIVSALNTLENDANNNKNVILYGLAFKADIDDLRESPAALIAEKLADLKNVNVYAVEPNIKRLPNTSVKLIANADAEHIEGVHVLLVNHKQFYNRMPTSKNIIIDTKGIWSN
jgi:UDP-N-acetyl-D-mannosaminuronic acid dehydrogenase